MAKLKVNINEGFFQIQNQKVLILAESSNWFSSYFKISLFYLSVHWLIHPDKGEPFDTPSEIANKQHYQSIEQKDKEYMAAGQGNNSLSMVWGRQTRLPEAKTPSLPKNIVKRWTFKGSIMD